MFLKLLTIFLPILNILYLYGINMDSSKFKLFTMVFVIINVFVLSTLVVFYRSNQKSLTNIFIYYLFIISLISSFIFIKFDFLKIIFYVIGFIVSFLSLLHIRYLIIHNGRENYFLNDVDFYIFLFSSFLATSSLFAFNIFLGLNKILLAFITFIYFFIFYFCIYYYHTKNLKDVYRYIFTSAIVSSEVFVVTSFSPYSFYVNAGIVLLFNYLLSSVVKDYILNKFNFKQFKRILVITVILLIIILITAKRV